MPLNFQLASLSAMNNVIQEELHSSKEYKEDINDSKLSESRSYSTSAVLEQSKSITKQSKHECHFCNKTFTRARYLTKHK